MSQQPGTPARLDLSNVPNTFTATGPTTATVHLDRQSDWPAEGATVEVAYHQGGNRWAGKATHEGKGVLRVTDWERVGGR